MAKEIKVTGLMIAVFVILIIGTVLLGVIATQEQEATQLAYATETVNLAPARLAGGAINSTYYFHLTNGCPFSTWRADQGSACYINNLGVKNSTGGTLVDPTNYVFVSNGAVCTGANSGDIRFTNTLSVNNSASNTTTVSYSYCPDAYLTQSWARTVLDLMPGFFAIGLLGAALMFGIAYYKGEF